MPGLNPLDPLSNMLQLQMPQLPPGYMGVQPDLGMGDLQLMQQPSAPAQAPGMPAPGVADFLKQLEQQGAFEKPKAQPQRGLQAQGQTIKEEQGGMSPEMRAEGVAVRGEAAMADANVDADRLLAQAEEFRKRADDLRAAAQVEEQQRKQQEQELAAKQERLRGQQGELAKQADEPINPDRYFQNMSVFAKASALLSAGIHGYLGRPGQAPVIDTLVGLARQDTQAQLANVEQARAQRNSLIAQYERQYGDTTLVAKRLEADKLLTMSKQANAAAMDAKSDDARASAEDLKKKLQNRVGVLHQEIQEATMGKPIEVTTTYGLPKSTSVDPTKKVKEALEMDKLMEQQGYTREQRAVRLKSLGLEPPAGDTATEKKDTLDTRDQIIKENEAAAKATGNKPMTDEAKRKLADRVDGLAEATRGFHEMDAVTGINRETVTGEVTRGKTDQKKLDNAFTTKAQQFGDAALRSIPFKAGEAAADWASTFDTEEQKALRRAADKIVFGQAKAEGQGALSDGDRATYRARLPVTDPETFKHASAEVFRMQKQNYKNLVGEYGQAAVDEMLRARGIDPELYGKGP